MHKYNAKLYQNKLQTTTRCNLHKVCLKCAVQLHMTNIDISRLPSAKAKRVNAAVQTGYQNKSNKLIPGDLPSRRLCTVNCHSIANGNNQVQAREDVERAVVCQEHNIHTTEA